jgi:hypothetical protein
MLYSITYREQKIITKKLNQNINIKEVSLDGSYCKRKEKRLR